MSLFDRFEVTITDVEEPILECDCCGGMGVIDVGDCENGIWDECPRCQGTGVESIEA